MLLEHLAWCIPFLAYITENSFYPLQRRNLMLLEHLAWCVPFLAFIIEKLTLSLLDNAGGTPFPKCPGLTTIPGLLPSEA